jgi:hypothetical protein
VLPLERWLGDFVSQFKQGVRSEGMVSVGNDPAEEILRRTRGQIDLIAMATHRSPYRKICWDRPSEAALPMKWSALRRYRSWSRPQRILRCPGMKCPETVRLPLTVSWCRWTAPLFGGGSLPYVEDLAQRLPLEVGLVRVVQVNVRDAQLPYTGGGMPVDRGGVHVQVEAEQAEEAEVSRYLKGVADNLAGKGLRVRWELLRGVPNTSISGLARNFLTTLLLWPPTEAQGCPGGYRAARRPPKTSSGAPETQSWLSRRNCQPRSNVGNTNLW